MDDYTLSNIVLQAFCGLMLGIILASQLFSVNRRKPLNRIFMRIVALILVALVADAIAWAIDKTPGPTYRLLINILNFMVYSFGVCGNAVLALYISKSIPLKKRIERRMLGLTWFVAIAFHALLILSQFTDWIYYLDADNGWKMGPLGWLDWLVCFVIYAICIVVVIQHRKQLGLRDTLAYISYVALPVIAVIENFFFMRLMTVPAAWALALLVIYANVHIQKGILAKEQELELQNQRIAVMLSQIQPHFLYNTLADIRRLCALDADKAREALASLSTYLRGNMDSLTQNSPIPFTEELEHVNVYLALEKMRFGDRLGIIFDIKAHDFSLPALSIQPIVENAVRHGITKKVAGGTVTIRTEENADSFIVTIMDDCDGFDPAMQKIGKDGHIGIANVKSRLAAMCGGRLEIASAPGNGTTAIITIPKEDAPQ